jgi:hypothetical protein
MTELSKGLAELPQKPKAFERYWPRQTCRQMLPPKAPSQWLTAAGPQQPEASRETQWLCNDVNHLAEAWKTAIAVTHLSD